MVKIRLKSNKQISEVGVHNLGLFLLDFGVRVVWWEDQIDFTAKRIDADHPEVAGIHLLL